MVIHFSSSYCGYHYTINTIQFGSLSEEQWYKRDKIFNFRKSYINWNFQNLYTCKYKTHFYMYWWSTIPTKLFIDKIFEINANLIYRLLYLFSDNERLCSIIFLWSQIKELNLLNIITSNSDVSYISVYYARSLLTFHFPKEIHL